MCALRRSVVAAIAAAAVTAEDADANCEALRLGSTDDNACGSGTFVDIGANVGDSARDWFHKPSCHKVVERCSNTWPWWLQSHDRRRQCVVLVEANPAHAQNLKQAAQKLHNVFNASIVVLPCVAFSTQAGTSMFGIDKLWGTGSSLELSRRAMGTLKNKGRGAVVGETATKVTTVDAVNFLAALRPGPISLKVDIEGTEFPVMRHLLMSGVLCRRVHNLWVEWHNPSAGEHLSADTFQWLLTMHDRNASELFLDDSGRSIRSRGIRSNHPRRPLYSEHCVTTPMSWS